MNNLLFALGVIPPILLIAACVRAMKRETEWIKEHLENGGE